MMHALETDYLVIGAGAMGMAFADELLHSDRHCRVLMLDRRGKPGGHWNDAYPFVTLHQPALFYGVNSTPLGDGGHDLVSKSQILSYYEQVLAKLLRTGRLTFLPHTECRRDGAARSLLNENKHYQIDVKRKIVDASYSQLTIPATSPPPFDVAPDVSIIPPNGLVSLDRPRRNYVVIGAGKTGLDALLYLRQQGVPTTQLHWVVSRDAWLLARECFFPDQIAQSGIRQLRAFGQAKDPQDLYQRLEKIGQFMRIEPQIEPTCYRCATVSQDELATLRTIENVIRKGRVTRISSTHIHLADGDVPLPPDAILINATADGLAQRPKVPVFQEKTIVLQPIFHCQPTLSGALIGKLESLGKCDATNNELLSPIPHPQQPIDILPATYTSFLNIRRAIKHCFSWFMTSRLVGGNHAGFFANLRLLWFLLWYARSTRDNMQRLIEEHVHPEMTE